MLKGKKILLGITGSIAAYKSVLLVRELVRAGAQVQVILTPGAKDFVTPLTLSTLAKTPVLSDFVADPDTGTWTNHVELGKWADLLLIAPLSASTLSKMVSGQCDNLLMAVYLSATCPVMVAPAMDLDMYRHWTTAENLDKLQQKHVMVIDAEEGELASGLVGKGRMAEIDHLLTAVQDHFTPKGKLVAKRIVITAGPTYEPIDPVRFIGNHSSGKMGYALAGEAAERGASVVLISGPTHLTAGDDRIQVIRVTTAAEMLEATTREFAGAAALIMAAAVADYTPRNPHHQKIKKETSRLTTLELEETTDILQYLGAMKTKQKLIGFALETENELANAKRKLENKKLDMLVMNSLQDKGAGFGTDTNKVTFVYPARVVHHDLKEKRAVAKDILDALEELF